MEDTQSVPIHLDILHDGNRYPQIDFEHGFVIGMRFLETVLGLTMLVPQCGILHFFTCFDHCGRFRLSKDCWGHWLLADDCFFRDLVDLRFGNFDSSTALAQFESRDLYLPARDSGSPNLPRTR